MRAVKPATVSPSEQHARDVIRNAIHAVIQAQQACNVAGCDGSAVTQGLESALADLRHVKAVLEGRA